MHAQTIADSFLYRHGKAIRLTPIRYVKLGIGLRIKVRGLFLVDCAAYSASLHRRATRIIRQKYIKQNITGLKTRQLAGGNQGRVVQSWVKITQS